MLTLAWVTLGLWLTGFVLAVRLQPRLRTVRPVHAKAVSVVIPARNEARNLPRLLRSLAAQPDQLREVIVVDDNSSDDTPAIAREQGATVLSSGPLPEGWSGKTWACLQGAQAARGDFLLFLDADTWFEPGGLERVLSAYPGGAFSVGPYHRVENPYEELSCFFNIAMSLGTVPNGLFGQMLLLKRHDYLRSGGHELVRAKILENFRMADQLRAAGLSVRSSTGRGSLSFRMYPNGTAELMRGWAKAFASGAGQTPRAILLLIVCWMTGLMFAPLGWALSGSCLPWALLYAACGVQVFLVARRVGAFRWYSAALYPVPLIFFFALFAWSMARSGKAVEWKGRAVRAD